MANAIGILVFVATFAVDIPDLKQLDQLLAWHIHYGLPLPPQDAVLLKVVTRPSVTHRDGITYIDSGSRFVTFALDDSMPWKITSIKCVKPTASLVRDDVSANWLEIALLAHERGWKPLALAAFRKWKSDHGKYTEEEFAFSAWIHWMVLIHKDPDVPLSVIAKYMRRALPLVHDHTDADLLRSVELAVKPRNSPPGSDEALIDDLVNLRDWPREENGGSGYQKDPRYRDIVRRGLAIVPALIAHLDDDRVTRIRACLVLRVKDIVNDILRQFHGGVSFFDDDDERIAIKNWFAGANKLGEEKYLTERLFSKDLYFPNTLLWLLAEKYPQRLPDISHKFIDKVANRGFYAWNFENAWYFAKTVAEARIPNADKRRILQYAASQKDLENRVAGIYYLRPFDPKLAKERVLQCLAEMPAKSTASQYDLARIIAEGADLDEWKALSLVVRRATPDERIELLRLIARAKTSEGRKHRLAFLADYLTDDTWMDRPTAFSGFWCFEVRNFAAMELADVLKIDAEPEGGWTAAQWAELRAKVQAKVKEELQR